MDPAYQSVPRQRRPRRTPAAPRASTTRLGRSSIDSGGGADDATAILREAIDLAAGGRRRAETGGVVGPTLRVKTGSPGTAPGRREATALSRALLFPEPRRPVPTTRLRLRLAAILLLSGEPEQALREMTTVLADDMPDELYAGVQLACLMGLIGAGESAEARRRVELILAGDDHPGDDSSLAVALTALAVISLEEGRVVDALSLFRASVERIDRTSMSIPLTFPWLGLVVVLISLGKLGAAEAQLAEGGTRLEGRGDLEWVPPLAVLRARLDLAAGRLDESSNAAWTALDAAGRLGTRILVPQALSTLATVALLRDDVTEADRLIGHFSVMPTAAGDIFGSAALVWIRARVADAMGGPCAAVELMAPVYEDPAAHRRLFIEEPGSAAWLVRVAMAVGDEQRAGRVVACAEQIGADNRELPSIAAMVAHARGLLNGDPVDLAAAAAGHPDPWNQGAAHEDAADALAGDGTGSGRDAGVHLQRAVERYEGIGATRDVRRARAKLGGARAEHRRTPRPVSGWASLTATECRVAAVVSEGLTNARAGERLFISRHTIDFHLRQIFRKLDIGSRVVLTRIVYERQGSTEPPS